MCSSSEPPPAEPGHPEACSYPQWHALFSRHAWRTCLLPLPAAFVDYLLADGVYVGEQSKALPRRRGSRSSSSSSEAEDASSSFSDQEEAPDWSQTFPQLQQAITDSIAELGGQVVLMLKSSDRIAHDLDVLSAQGTAATPVLVLRKWHDLRPEREWRCFVHDHELVGVSQRDPTQLFPQLCSPVGATESMHHSSSGADAEVAVGGMVPGPAAREAAALLLEFHRRHVKGRFPLADYCFDAYVATSNAIRLVDFNPVGPGSTTSPLLFSWQELGLEGAQLGMEVAELRLEGTQIGLEGAQQEGLRSAQRPLLTGEASPEGGSQGAGTGPQTTGVSGVSGSQGGTAGTAQGLRAGGVVQQVTVRVVLREGWVHPGQRAAVAMPFDMLGLDSAQARDYVSTLNAS